MRQHFALQECLDAARFEQRDLLGVTKLGVRLVLDDRRLAAERRLKQAS